MSVDGYNSAWIAAARRALGRLQVDLDNHGVRAHTATGAMRDISHALVMLEKGPCKSGACTDQSDCRGESVACYVGRASLPPVLAPVVEGREHRRFKFRYHRRKRA